ncbi:MAG: UvrD-helicase domain-containing protein [Bryobacterales bacterium]
MESLLEDLRGADDFVEKLKRLKDLPQTRYSDEQWTVIEALLEILPAAAGQLRLVFGERGLVDFSELTTAALHALEDGQGPSDLAMAFDRKIEHLLVDEFQDTSQSQMALLERLTEGWTPGDGRTVFLVGDPMQSIYRFREAEVGLFLRTVKSGLPTVEIEPLRLTVNFRSRSNIVGWVNETFPTVFPAEEDIAKGAVRFAESACASEEAPGPDVEVHPFWDPQGSTAEGQPEAEAAKVVEIVERARAANKSVAVLARARTHLPHILAALRQAGQRYRAIEIDPLATSPAVLDLMALTAALLHPGDRVSWLAVLRAPWCGLSLADLHALTGDALKAALPELIEDAVRRERLSEDGRRRLERLRAAMAAPRQRTLRAWVEGVWLRLGGPATVRNEAGLVDAEAYLDLLDKLDEGCDVDLDRLKVQVANLFAAPDPGAGDAIEVMTIHKAKGLEFDVVIVPGLGRRAKGDDEQLLLWLESPADERGGEPELLLAPIKSAATKENPIYNFVQSREGEKERHERQRLLYVAATRAKSELHWLGAVKIDKNGAAGEPGKGSMLHLLWPRVKETFQSPFETDEALVDETRKPQPLRRLASDWEAPQLETPASEDERKPVDRYRWEGERARLAGTVVHDLLQEIGREGAQAWSAERVRSVRPRFERALRSAGVRKHDLEETVDMVERAATRALEDERGRWILDGNHEEAWSEVSLAGMDGGKVIERRIDRTFIDKDGVRWIIDFKTSDYTREDVEAFLRTRMEAYREQMEQYRSLYRRLESRPVRIGLYFPLLGAWREYDAQADAAKV